MAKSRRKRGKAQARRFDPLAARGGRAASREGGAQTMEVEEESNLRTGPGGGAMAQLEGEEAHKPEAAAEEEEETRGQMERRHHHELKQWRLEEGELRRQRNGLKKRKTPEVDRERKRILQEIKDKAAAIEARHAAELQGLLDKQATAAAAAAEAATPAAASTKTDENQQQTAAQDQQEN